MISVTNYNDTRGIYSPLVEHNGCVCGYWLTGNDYRGNGYYGGYPPNYLKRIRLLFPYEQNALHLFAGMTKKGTFPYEITLDSNPKCNPDLLGDAECLLPTKEKFQIIIADPPYEKNHTKYGTSRMNKRKMLKLCVQSLVVGGYLVWLDTRIPMWSKKDGWVIRGLIGLNQSTQHLTRTITILEKVYSP